MNEENNKSKDIEKEMDGLMHNSSSYFNLGALLTGLCVSALFLFLTLPEGSNLTLLESQVVFYLTLATFLFLTSVLIFIMIPIRVSKFREKYRNEPDDLEKKVKFEGYQIELGRYCIIGGLGFLLVSVFNLIVYKDPNNGFFTYLSAFVILVIIVIITFYNKFRAGIHKISSNQDERRNLMKNLQCFIIALIITGIVVVLLLI